MTAPAPKVLCQDCLAIADYTDERHTEQEMCACGGAWCGCLMCDRAAHALLSGDRAAARHAGAEITDSDFWCEETGVRREGSA